LAGLQAEILIFNGKLHGYAFAESSEAHTKNLLFISKAMFVPMVAAEGGHRFVKRSACQKEAKDVTLW
jgi:hypothetical protein